MELWNKEGLPNWNLDEERKRRIWKPFWDGVFETDTQLSMNEHTDKKERKIDEQMEKEQAKGSFKESHRTLERQASIHRRGPPPMAPLFILPGQQQEKGIPTPTVWPQRRLQDMKVSFEK